MTSLYTPESSAISDTEEGIPYYSVVIMCHNICIRFDVFCISVIGENHITST